MSKAKASPRKELHLVKFRKEYFPAATRDLEVLKEHSLSVARITESALTVISRTLLRGVKIVYHPWAQVYEGLTSAFKASFPSGHEFKSEENWILIQSEGEVKDRLAFVESRITLLQRYCARYGFKVLHLTKARKGYFLTRLLFVPDPSIVPSLSFGDSDTMLASPTEFKFNLSPSCRLVLVKKKSPTGLDNIKVSFEDRYGDDYQEAFSRAFNFNGVRQEDCEAGLNFFATLLSLVHKSRRYGE